jgi:hypothetical protein
MSQIRQLHRGYIVQATSFAIRGGGYTPHLDLIKHSRAYSDETPVHTGKVFASDEAALEGGIAIGKDMIDAGFVPNKIVIVQNWRD